MDTDKLIAALIGGADWRLILAMIHNQDTEESEMEMERRLA